MTDQLDSRTTRTVTAFMDETDHPIRRSTFTPADGLAVASTVDEGATAEKAPAVDESPAVDHRLSIGETPSVGDDAEPDRGFPRPPERGSLDDEHLVPLVGRHTDDTATVDLIGILQAQMQLRAAEAERFANWEAEILRIGTEEALDELERTRLHFTGVIPVQTGQVILTAASAPEGAALVPERILPGPEQGDSPIIPTGTAPEASTEADAVNPHVERARLADDELLERADDTAVPGSVVASPSPRTVVAASVSVLAVLVIVASLILVPLGASSGFVAAVAAVGVMAAAWLGLAIGRLALRGRGVGSEPAAATGRTTWAIVAGLVSGTIVGEGLVRTPSDAFALQGYLLSLVQVHGFHVELSIVAGLVTACIVAFVVVVLVDRGRAAPAADSAVKQDQPAD